MDLIISRACERLKQMRIQQARPDPEKAAKMQELHRKLRVCFKFFVFLCWVECEEKTRYSACTTCFFYTTGRHFNFFYMNLRGTDPTVCITEVLVFPRW